MFRHVFMARLREGIGETDVDALLGAWRAMGEAIDDVVALSAGRNLSVDDRSYEIVLVVDFADRAAWQRYMVHPTHLAVRSTLSARCLDPVARVSAQYVLDAPGL